MKPENRRKARETMTFMLRSLSVSVSPRLNLNWRSFALKYLNQSILHSVVKVFEKVNGMPMYSLFSFVNK